MTQKSAGISLSKIAECFLGFGVNPSTNISKLTQFCGELLGADSSVYDRMEGLKLTRLGGWNLPTDLHFLGFGKVTAGLESIQVMDGDFFEIRHLESDAKCLHTFFGRLVKDQGVSVGALSVIFNSSHVLSEGDREVLGIVAAAIAIEDQRLRAEELVVLQQLKMVATAKMSALGEMAAGVSHEISNPLLVMLLRIEQLRGLIEYEKSSQEVVQAVNGLEALTLRISKIIKSLRQFSGDTEGEAFQVVNLREIIDEAIGFCGERFKHHGIDLQVENLDDALGLRCRPTELCRVFLNLLSNAYDAVNDSSSQKWIKIIVREENLWLEIAVVDSGGGVPIEVQEKIFLPFFSTKGVNHGKGLGLSVAKGIVDQHQGMIFLDSESKSTRFVVRLPGVQGVKAV